MPVRLPINKKLPSKTWKFLFLMVGVAELESATPCVSCKEYFFALNKL